MEALMEALGVNWVEIFAVIISIVLAYSETKKYGLKKHLNNALIFARGAATAIEIAESGKAKDIVKKIIKENVGSNPGLVDINTIVMATIDPKPAGDVPAIKRFWRRAIRGQNVAGVLGKIALKAAGVAVERKAEKLFED